MITQKTLSIELIKNSLYKFGINFDYSLIPPRVSLTTRVSIICKKHGEFTTTFKSHMQYIHGDCPQCKKENRNAIISDSERKSFFENKRIEIKNNIKKDSTSINTTFKFNSEELPQVAFIKITPDLARELLLYCNEINRDIKIRYVDQIVDDMKSGNWDEYNGETIKFTKNMMCADGQKRLASVFVSGMSYYFLCVLNIEENSIKTIDLVDKRTLKDLLKINNYGTTSMIKTLDCCINHINSLETNHNNINMGFQPQNCKAWDIVETKSIQEWKDMYTTVHKWFIKGGMKGKVPEGMLMAYYYLIEKYDKDFDTKNFFKHAIGRTDVDDNSHEQRFRIEYDNWFDKEMAYRRADNKPMRAVYARKYFIYLFVKCYHLSKQLKSVIGLDRVCRYVPGEHDLYNNIFWFYRDDCKNDMIKPIEKFNKKTKITKIKIIEQSEAA